MHSSLCKTSLSVVVLHRSMVNWRRGVGSVCHGYMCILLYVKLMCSGGVYTMVNWKRGWGQSAMGILHSSLCETFSV